MMFVADRFLTEAYADEEAVAIICSEHCACLNLPSSYVHAYYSKLALLENMRDACWVWKLRHLIVASCIWNFAFSSPLSQLV
ncbi:hypothetical protein QL285_079496 [Trifolium repens]|nr:hypothetical protein QL285_079496 [Trifolium repens]